MSVFNLLKCQHAHWKVATIDNCLGESRKTGICFILGGGGSAKRLIQRFTQDITLFKLPLKCEHCSLNSELNPFMKFS